jgi:hypothetical protein
MLPAPPGPKCLSPGTDSVMQTHWKEANHQSQGNRPENELDADQRERWSYFPPA